MRPHLLLPLLLACAGGPGHGATGAPPSPPSDGDSLLAIARDIEGRKGSFPQLAGFSADVHCDRARLVIQYQHRTHAPTGRGGWSAAVVPPFRLRDRPVTLLILEGAHTPPLAGTLAEILLARGVQRGAP